MGSAGDGGKEAEGERRYLDLEADVKAGVHEGTESSNPPIQSALHPFVATCIPVLPSSLPPSILPLLKNPGLCLRGRAAEGRVQERLQQRLQARSPCWRL